METLTPVSKITKDIKDAATRLSDVEARYLVAAYYQMQNDRIRADHRARIMEETHQPNLVMSWLGAQSDSLETQVKRALDAYSMSHPVGEWMRSICGVGPVIAAGLLAHIDITKCPTVGHIWSFAGLKPDSRKVKGEKLAYNAELKTLCAFKLGESFVKVQNNDSDIYGKVYVERKKFEHERNERGDNAELAAKILVEKKISKATEAYKALSKGKLPPAQIHARARRYSVKLFLAHLHDHWYRYHFGKAPPLPYAIAILGHAHYIEPPVMRAAS